MALVQGAENRYCMSVNKLVTALLVVLCGGVMSCKKGDYVKKDQIESKNGYVKGVVRGLLSDGTVIDESFNLEYSDLGDNTVIKYVEDAVFIKEFNVYNRSSVLNMANFFCTTDFFIIQDARKDSLVELNFSMVKKLKDNRVLNIQSDEGAQFGITEFNYDANKSTIEGGIVGKLNEDTNLYLELSFKVKVLEEISK